MKKCIAVIQMVLLGILMTATLSGAAETGCLLPVDNWLVFVSSEGTGPFSFSIAVMDTNGTLIPESNIIALSARGNPYVFETSANTADVSLACDTQDGTAYIFHDSVGELTLTIIQDIVPAPPPTFSISGTITSGGLPLSGVSMTLTGAATANTTTNASGVYTFTGLANGNYSVTPNQAGFTFTPVNRAVVINNANVTGQDFTGTAAGSFSISGTIRTPAVGPSGGTSIPGVTVTLGGAATANTTTNASGVYTFTGLANGSYTVTPSLAGFTFTPVNRAVVINNANVTGQDFTGTAAAATFSISGTVTSGGLPLSGVSIALTGAATATTTTNASGVYTFTGLANGSYTVTPSLAGFTFTPVNRAVVINNANVTGQDFTGTAAATFSISGTIRTPAVGPGGGSPIAGVTVTLGGAAAGMTTTNASGVYTFTSLANGSYTVTPSLAGFTFVPVNRAVVINNANVTGQDFTRN